MQQNESDGIRCFRDLRVYRLAFQTAETVFEVTEDWPRCERYAMTDQIRRSSRSVCANIGEAWYKRRYPRAFVSKLNDAGSEASETLVWLDFATAFGYLRADDAQHLQNDLEYVIGGLTKMAEHPEKWCVVPT